ncbi:CbtB-domain containing protein [Streptomyces sp. DHE17-7]|nr:CbtB-domain containing protein [Streptomyces sp. DHE17-7]
MRPFFLGQAGCVARSWAIGSRIAKIRHEFAHDGRHLFAGPCH